MPEEHSTPLSFLPPTAGVALPPFSSLFIRGVLPPSAVLHLAVSHLQAPVGTSPPQSVVIFTPAGEPGVADQDASTSKLAVAPDEWIKTNGLRGQYAQSLANTHILSVYYINEDRQCIILTTSIHSYVSSISQLAANLATWSTSIAKTAQLGTTQLKHPSLLIFHDISAFLPMPVPSSPSKTGSSYIPRPESAYLSIVALALSKFTDTDPP